MKLITLALLLAASTAFSGVVTFPESAGASKSAAQGATGWVDDGSIVRLQTSTDLVGIGTATPLVELHIYGSNAIIRTEGTTAGRWQAGDPNATAGSRNFDMRSQDDLLRFSVVSDDWSTFTQDSVIVMDNVGKMGFNTLTPASTLDVVGTFSWGAADTKSTATATGGLDLVGEGTAASSFTFTNNSGRLIYNEANACGKTFMDADNHYEVVATSNPGSATDGTAWETVDLTALNNTNAKAAKLRVECNIQNDSGAGTQQLFLYLQAGGVGGSIATTQVACGAQLTLANAWAFDYNDVWVILDASKDFEYNCRGTDPANTTNTRCTIWLGGYCE